MDKPPIHYQYIFVIHRNSMKLQPSTSKNQISSTIYGDSQVAEIHKG